MDKKTFAIEKAKGILQLEKFIDIKTDKLWNDFALDGDNEVMANDLLDNAMLIIRWQTRLIKALKENRCNKCNEQNADGECIRVGVNGDVGVCWMEKSEGEY